MAENRQSRRSRELIADALLDLMKKKDYTEITVTDITEKAGVARLTFYRHFQTKDEVLADRFRQLFADYTSQLEKQEAKTLTEALTLCFTFWRQNGEEVKLLKKNGLDAILYQPFDGYLRTMLERYHVSGAILPIQEQFLVGGLYFAMIRFVTGEDRQTPSDAAGSVLDILKIDPGKNRWSFPAL